MRERARQSQNESESPVLRHPRSKGFTLLEIIVVIAILGILSAVAVPTLDLLQTGRRSEDTLTRMEILRVALESYFEDQLVFPKTLQDLEKDLYLTSTYGSGDAFLDGWGNGFIYSLKANGATIVSLGPDQVDSASNLTMTVDGTRFLIAESRDRMETIHIALRNYESRRVPDGLSDLPTLWFDKSKPSAMGALILGGYIGNSMRFAHDAWGDDYVYQGSPYDFVTSPNL